MMNIEDYPNIKAIHIKKADKVFRKQLCSVIMQCVGTEELQKVLDANWTFRQPLLMAARRVRFDL